ncbi:hypothetical protein BAUCODRAFT_34433 [Baudoinia panamericana UAMH 10762]|uniref:Uncharacterized protein n=1 Tax=Baudoinia panamericana (strain UAMH 10762) TaxID=717646 RepID=M2MVS3_BAUPA|nr:uncharacterized protein BAUCODRAFT_34433 [Baudoinia panamericana UAMH 10762]EMC95668.1 hypothetical protein BAUCODRAFT_34433 [Baudoinia panamericana UAMH 10762]
MHHFGGGLRHCLESSLSQVRTTRWTMPAAVTLKLRVFVKDSIGSKMEAEVTSDSQVEVANHTPYEDQMVTDSALPSTSDGMITLEQLSTMSFDERQDKYWECFHELDAVPIEKLAIPDLCHEYPPFGDEIFAAYLRYTTFSCKTWVNYDATACMFYVDEQRLKTCGKLRISAIAMQHLLETNLDRAPLPTVRFDVGTPFRSLAYLTLEVRMTPNGPAIDPYVHILTGNNNGKHDAFFQHLDTKTKQLQEGKFNALDGKEGFVLADLQRLVAWLVAKPDKGERDARDRHCKGWGAFQGSLAVEPRWNGWRWVDFGGNRGFQAHLSDTKPKRLTLS